MLIRKIKNLYNRYFLSFEQQALKAGVRMGKDNQFLSNFWSSEPYLIEIGDNCQITAGVKFFTHGGAKIARIIDSSFDCFGKIKIGSNVYIGTNSLLMPGVTVGDNVLISAGSVVTHSVPSNVVIGGNPAHIICSFEDYYQKNQKYNVGTKGLNSCEKRKVLLSLNEEKFIRK